MGEEGAWEPAPLPGLWPSDPPDVPVPVMGDLGGM